MKNANELCEIATKVLEEREEAKKAEAMKKAEKIVEKCEEKAKTGSFYCHADYDKDEKINRYIYKALEEKGFVIEKSGYYFVVKW